MKIKPSELVQGHSTRCLLWLGAKAGRGYGIVHLKNPRRNVYVHRVFYESKFGPIPKGKIILHSCDVPNCVNVHHLRVGTHKDNMLDCSRKGRADGGSTKITREIADEIRRLYESGKLTQKQIGLRYGLVRSQISHIVLWKQWVFQKRGG